VDKIQKNNRCNKISSSSKELNDTSLQNFVISDNTTPIFQGRECKNCGRLKSWIQFDKKITGQNGYDSRCKECISKSKKKYAKRLLEIKLALKTRKRKESSVLDIQNINYERKELIVNAERFDEIMQDFIDTIISHRQIR
jgi:hypothetical protein